jgi:hypothetical protein
MRKYQCELFKGHHEAGSWRQLAERSPYNGKINHATLHRYAHGDPVIDAEHKRILGITKPRPRRVAVHCSDLESAYATLTNPDNFSRYFMWQLVDRMIREYFEPFEV